MTAQLEIIRPDDWHCHLRDGGVLETTIAASAKTFSRVIVMPNLQPPITNVKLAKAYRERILSYNAPSSPFTPLMTLYLTGDTTEQTIIDAKSSKIIYGCKLYPHGVTTNADSGVNHIKSLYKIFEAMQRNDIPLLIHGEVSDNTVDIFDRERLFLETVLPDIVSQFPQLRIVLEHITTSEAVDFITKAPKNVAATITPQHLYMNRNDLLLGRIRPHNYCLPILKRSTHQAALIKAATSGNAKFFIGTDSAPHAKSQKESACGCAGIFNAPNAIFVYAEVFEAHGKLDKLEGFTSKHGADFYGLPYNTQKLRLIKKDWVVPDYLKFGNEVVIPFLAGKTLSWQEI